MTAGWNLITIDATSSLRRPSIYEGRAVDIASGDQSVPMAVLNGDPMLAMLLIGSAVLYYWLLYSCMRRNKNKSGSYWRG